MTIPKRDKATDIASEIAQGKFLRKRIVQNAEDAANRFMAGENLNDVIADISERENYSQVQIQRLVEEANTLAHNKKYAELKKVNDRRISFDVASLHQVVEKMGDKAPPSVDNPNWVKGRPGTGEMVKKASVQMPYNIHQTTEHSRERIIKRQSARDIAALKKEASFLSRSIESGLFKVAQSIVRSEQVYKNGNQLFNTLLSEASLDNVATDGIVKKAEEIVNRLKETGRVHGGFMVSLSVEPTEKVASALMGEYSLTKNATDASLVQEPKVAPVQNVEDYQKLISLAKQIQANQSQSFEAEQKLQKNEVSN